MLYASISRTSAQFVVVGAVRDSPAYSKMEDGTIRIFDVIESVNDRTAGALQSEYEKEPQQCFDNHLKYRAAIKLRINRSMSLLSISTTLRFGMSLNCYAINSKCILCVLLIFNTKQHADKQFLLRMF